MSKIVLHIGTHKTGTTTIQDTFWHNADVLAQHGLIYPKLGTITGHHALVFDWVRLPRIFEDPRGSRALLKGINDAYAGGDDTVFLSSEELSRADPESQVDLQELRALLSGFDSIEVICMLRPQWALLQSVYLEILKNANPLGPGFMVQNVCETGMAEGLWFDYSRLLDRLEAVFVPDEITFLDYAQACAHPQGIVGAVLDTQGISLPDGALQPVNGGRSNVSAPALASFLAYTFTEPEKPSPQLVNLLSDLFETLSEAPVQQTCIFPQAHFHKLASHFAPSNLALEQRRQQAQPGFHLTPPDFNAVSYFQDRLPPGMWIQLSRALIKRAPFE